MKVPARNYQLTEKQIETIEEALECFAKTMKGVDANYARRVGEAIKLQTRKLDHGVAHVGNSVTT